jgi:hypothetical protein
MLKCIKKHWVDLERDVAVFHRAQSKYAKYA